MSQQVKITKRLDLASSATVKGIAKVEKTANYTCTMDDSGKVLVMNTSNNRFFTLPAVADAKGGAWIMVNANTGQMGVIGGTADKIVCLNDSAADQVVFSTANMIVGAACLVIGDGSLYYFFNLCAGTATPSG